MNKEEINKQIIDLRIKKLLLLSKKVSIIALSNIVLITGLKLSGIGYPFIKDKEKKYKASATTINNLNNNKIIKEKYINKRELYKYKNKKAILLIKDNYKKENDLYIKKVSTYKLDKNKDYKKVLTNYKKYISPSNILNNYQEKNNYNIPEKKEIIIKYYNINKFEYIITEENNYNNILSSSIYIIILLYGSPYLYSLIDDTNKINSNIKRLKKRKD